MHRNVESGWHRHPTESQALARTGLGRNNGCTLVTPPAALTSANDGPPPRPGPRRRSLPPNTTMCSVETSLTCGPTRHCARDPCGEIRREAVSPPWARSGERLQRWSPRNVWTRRKRPGSRSLSTETSAASLLLLKALWSLAFLCTDHREASRFSIPDSGRSFLFLTAEVLAGGQGLSNGGGVGGGER